MIENLHLDSEEVTRAAHHILFLLAAFLVVTFVVALRMTTEAQQAAEAGTSFRERTAIRAKLFAWVAIAPAILLLIDVSGDILRLSVTFPTWGMFVIGLILLVVWIVGRFLFLNLDDVGDYTFEAERRDSIDAKWEAERLSKLKLRRELVGWSVGVVVAIVWLMALAHMSPRDVVRVFTS